VKLLICGSILAATRIIEKNRHSLLNAPHVISKNYVCDLLHSFPLCRSIGGKILVPLLIGSHYSLAEMPNLELWRRTVNRTSRIYGDAIIEKAVEKVPAAQ